MSSQRSSRSTGTYSSGSLATRVSRVVWSGNASLSDRDRVKSGRAAVILPQIRGEETFSPQNIFLNLTAKHVQFGIFGSLRGTILFSRWTSASAVRVYKTSPAVVEMSSQSQQMVKCVRTAQSSWAVWYFSVSVFISSSQVTNKVLKT